ncbi:MAG: cyclic lactone autoinducer peptide [Clostridia bacterium]|jgi:cyclic lactone autoinducer peptide|nr:cyclic lactone autoinducer peptide [Clostridia bacterium]
MKKSLVKKMADIVLKAAKSAAGSASDWCTYQPKEPKKLKEMLSK